MQLKIVQVSRLKNVPSAILYKIKFHTSKCQQFSIVMYLIKLKHKQNTH
jgi:hypothetical protein